MLTPLSAVLPDEFSEDRIVLRSRPLKVFVNDDNVVAVSLEFEDDVLLEQAEVNLIGHVDQLRNDHLLVLLMIDADERSIVPEIEER